MLETLFKAIKELQEVVQELSGDVTNNSSAIIAAAGMAGLLAPGDSDGSDNAGLLSVPGAPGPRGLIGSIGPTMFLPQDAADEPALVTIPGPIGPTGLTGASGTGSGSMIYLPNEDSGFESFDMLRPGIEPLPPVRCSAWRSTVQSVPAATFTALSLDSETYDVGGMHDPAVNPTRITIQPGQGGVYLCVGSTRVDVHAGNRTAVSLFQNGGIITANTVPASTIVTNDLETVSILELAAGDYMEVHGYQDSAGNVDFGSTNNAVACRLSVIRLSGL